MHIENIIFTVISCNIHEISNGYPSLIPLCKM